MAELQVIDPGMLTTVQDLGRPGWAHLGVPRSGALDQPALRLANRLVGNSEDAAALETTLTGCRVRLAAATSIAVTGAPCEVRLGERSLPWGEAVSVPRGDLLIGPAQSGVRSYLAISGGVLVEPVLGSRSTDLLAGLGPAPLAAGDRLPLGAPGVPQPGEAVGPGLGSVVRVRLGPREDWFADPDQLDGSTWQVRSDSNRVGLRLSGVPIRGVRAEELPSEPMVLGAIQVPAGGQPIVFLNDHPTTGGYPVIGVVEPEDLPICAQARPGESISFRLV